MNISRYQLKNLMWITPAIIAFLLALIPTFKYQWPLSWDIYYHVLMAHVYTAYGFGFTNPLNIPVNYPPLFHFLIAFLGILTKADYFQIARFLQPWLTMLVVLSVSYVGYRFYGRIAGTAAGFLVISSLLFGNRLIFPLPEILALIFLPLGVYFYYYSLKHKSLKYALLAGLILIIILLIHQAAPVILFFVITAFTLIELILYRNIHALKNYGAFILLPLAFLGTALVGILKLDPQIFMNTLQLAINMGVNVPLGLFSYGNLGVLTLIFGFIGAAAALIRRRKIDTYLLTWTVVIILLINAHLFGVNVESFRLLVYLLIPVSILAGFGLTQVYHRLKGRRNFSSKNFRTAFLISIFVLATLNGILTMENPLIAYNGINNQYGSVQIAPPTSSMEDLALWFNDHGDKSKSIISNDFYPILFVTAQSRMPLAAADDFLYLNNTTSKSLFDEKGIGYVVLDKRLSFQSKDGTFDRMSYGTDKYQLFYYSGNIHSNLNKIFPSFIKVVYEDQDFIVGQVQ